MKHLSIKMKITVLVSLLAIVMTTIAAGSVLFFSNSVTQSALRRTLIQTVERNINEVQIYREQTELKLDDEFDVSFEYQGFYIEVDDDFMREVDGVTTSLYDNSSVLYGVGVIDAARFPRVEKGIRTLQADGTRYFVYDKALHGENTEGLWMRGIVPAEQSMGQTLSILDSILMLLPLMLLLVVAGAFWLSRKALQPIDVMTAAAGDIRRGQDLSVRIHTHTHEEEVALLETAFNSMLERLETSFEKEKQFNADVSHELRTPLSVILSACEWSLEEPQSAEEYQESLEQIQRQGQKMQALINQLLAYSRLEAEAQEQAMEHVNFSALVQRVCDEMAPLCIKNIRLETEITPEIFVCGNDALLARLLSNLISNAYKYGKEDGKTVISLSRQDTCAVLRVRDNGIGIPAQEKDKIFQTFYRADASRSEEGYGLGLSFVKKIADWHDGNIRVESVEGAGSEFIYTQKLL